jgi:DNA topoisomerase-1
MNLVIVESFAKAKTIQKYLNKNTDQKFKVVASGGHLFDLSHEGKTFGLRDTENFEPIYELIQEKKATFKTLQQEVKGAATIWLAADNDREGEAIAWHLQRTLPAKNFRRIVFNEITPSAIKAAIATPRQIDREMVESQQTRRVLDRVIGYCLTNVLKKGFSSSGRVISAGRVQSVVLRLIVEKEREVEAHVSTRYWTVGGNFTDEISDATLYKDETVHKFASEKELRDFFAKISTKNVYEVETGAPSKVRESADPPFTTSMLQQRATSLGMSIQRTMALAQGLYERGHITYMRTDSTAISEEAKAAIAVQVRARWGEAYLNPQEKGRKPSKHVQGAHEAIRPTQFQERTPSAIKDPDESKLYQLIFDHTLASQMSPAIYCELKVCVRHGALPAMAFVSKMKALHFPGWRAAFGKPSDKKGLEAITRFQAKKTLSQVRCVDMRGGCVWSVPPARYGEATIIKKMEKEGIGRPSTYVSMVQKLYERHYVQKTDVAGEKKEYSHYLFTPKGGVKKETESRAYYSDRGRLVPNSSGSQVSEFMVKWFPNIVNVKFTSDMESTLDKIAAKRTSYVSVMRGFYKDFDNTCAGVLKRVTRSDLDDSSRRVTKKGRTVRMGRYGPLVEMPCSEKECKADTQKPTMYGLEAYMKFAKKTLGDVDDIDIDLIASMPKRVKNYVVRYGRYGFYVVQECKSSEGKTLTIYGRYSEDVRKNRWEFLDDMFKERPCPNKSDQNPKKAGKIKIFN